MKKFALICLFASMAFIGNAQNVEQKEVPEHGAKIRFEEMEHQYGTIMKGGNGDCEFVFWNDGDEPLILQSVKASCGCTTPTWTQKPVMPGQSGTIKVRYNTNNVGGFSKNVTVTSNAVNNDRVVLKIKGTVKQEQVAQPQQPQDKPAPKAPEKKDEKLKPVKAEPVSVSVE